MIMRMIIIKIMNINKMNSINSITIFMIKTKNNINIKFCKLQKRIECIKILLMNKKKQ
jgi:hypothetical protein